MKLLAAALALWMPLSAFAAAAAPSRGAEAAPVEGPAAPGETAETEAGEGETLHAPSFDAREPVRAAGRPDALAVVLRTGARVRPLHPPPNRAAPR